MNMVVSMASCWAVQVRISSDCRNSHGSRLDPAVPISGPDCLGAGEVASTRPMVKLASSSPGGDGAADGAAYPMFGSRSDPGNG